MLEQVSLQVSTLIKPQGSEEFPPTTFVSCSPAMGLIPHPADLAAPVSEWRDLSVVTTPDLATASGQITQPRASTPASTSEVSGNYNRSLGQRHNKQSTKCII